MNTVAQKVILVTGASRGIGAAVAQKLAQTGASVIVNYAGSQQAAEDIVSTIRQAGATPLLYRPTLVRPRT